MYTKCITERRIPKTWKEANGLYFQEREQNRYQELQTHLLAIKYLQTVHKTITTIGWRRNYIKINVENKHDLGASMPTLRQNPYAYMP